MARSPFRSFWYASSIFVLFLALFTPINTSLDGAPGNMYFWFFLGVSVRLADLEVARSAGLRAGHAVYRGGMGQPA